MKFSRKLSIINSLFMVFPVLLVTAVGIFHSMGIIGELVGRNSGLELDRLEEMCYQEYQTLVNLGISDMDFYRQNTQRKIIAWVEANPVPGAWLYIRSNRRDIVAPPAGSDNWIRRTVDFAPWRWELGIVTSPATLEAYAGQTIGSAGLIIILCLVPGLIISIILARSLSRPLENLRATAAVMGQGRLDVRARSGGGEEFAELAAAFNQMAASLEALTGELRQRVEERTAELASSRQELLATRRELLERERFAELGEMVASVTHEVNTPLGLCLTNSSYLEDLSREVTAKFGANSLTRHDLEDYLKSVAEASRSMTLNLSRANELMAAFKQLAVDQAVDRQRRFDVGLYLETIATSMARKLRNARVELICDLPRGIELDATPGPLYQIVTNLVGNSLVHGFAGKKGGQIHLRLGQEGNDLVLEYRDDGNGMSPEVKDRMYEEYFSTRHDSGGSGLGMNIVHTLVVEHYGGSIDCESSPGSGVRFLVRLPLPGPEAPVS